MRLRLPALVILAMFSFTTVASAAEYMAGDLRITDPWARATPGAARNGAAYVTIENRGSEPERLTAVASPVAGRAEVHTQMMENGVAKMRPAGLVSIPPGETVTLAPGGLHIMLMKLKQPLREGERVPLTLVFERTGRVDLEMSVAGAGATHPGH